MTDINSTINGGGASTQNAQVNPLGEFAPDRITRTIGQSLSSYTLSTSAQTIVGAINEILPKATGVGKVDATSNGTGEIFNRYEGEYANIASGNYSHAEGNDTTALRSASHAEGISTTAEGNYSHAEGQSTTAMGVSSHAEGISTSAGGSGSHAEGYNTSTAGMYSHAEGYRTTAGGISSHAEGYYTQTFSQSEHAEGNSNKSYVSEDASVRVIHSVGIGSSVDDRKNAHEIKFNGDHYIYGVGNFDGTNSADAQTLQEVINSKQETITAGTGLEMTPERVLNVTLDTTVFKVVSALPDSPAQGDENKIHLVPAESTGENNAYTEYAWVNSAWEILGEYTSEVDLTPYLKIADAVGRIDSTSDGTGEIFNSYEGDSANVASGNYSHAEGRNTNAIGNYSHAEGAASKAIGNYSHAEGSSATASGGFSHAEGNITKAIGNYSHAEGNATTAEGFCSHVEGGCTKAYGHYEHAEGVYNKSYDSEDASIRVIHSVGIGPTDVDRKNAHEIKFNGDHYIYGIGGYDGTNALDEGVKTLQQEIEDLSVKATGVGMKDSGTTGEIFNTYSGDNANTAEAHASHAEGVSNHITTNGLGSHVEGRQNNVDAMLSHVEGLKNIVTSGGNYSHVEGQENTVSANNVHVECYRNTISGYNTHVEGCYNRINSTGTHIEGNYIKTTESAHTIHYETGYITNVYLNADANSTEVYVSFDEGLTRSIYTPDELYEYLSNENIEVCDYEDYSLHKILSVDLSVRDAIPTVKLTLDAPLSSEELVNSKYGISRAIADDVVDAHIEGLSILVQGGEQIHAEGNDHTVKNSMSTHVEGSYHIVKNVENAHIEGLSNKVTNHYEHAEGCYNISNSGSTDELKTRHSVGIGKSKTDRKNADEIMVNGDHYIYGLGGYDGTNATDKSVKTLQTIIEEILINTQHPVIDYSAPDSAFTGTTLINSEGISAVNVWNVENYSRTDIFLLNSSGTTTDKIRYDVVRDTQYSDFQTAHEGDKIKFDEIIQLSTIVTNSFAESDLFIYHAKINDEAEAKYYLVDIVMTE